MLHLTLAGLSEDNERLILVSDSGEEFSLAIDARLRAALRGEYARLGQLEIQMESTLRPRDIQARIRAGATPEAVAAAAQTSLERILPFVNPVLAERAHVAERAQRSSVRRKTGDTGLRTLGEAVSAQLGSLSLGGDTVDWDAWRRDDGRWTLVGTYDAKARTGAGHFCFDLPGNYVTAEDDDARWLVGETLAPPAPTPRDDLEQVRRRRQSVDAEDQLPLGDDALAMVHSSRSPEVPEVPEVPEPVVPAAVVDPSTAPTVDLTETARAARAAGAAAGPDPRLSVFEPVEDDVLAPTPEPLADEPTPRHQPVAAAEPAGEPEADAQKADDPATRKASRRKGRASVPSWDEIMFGGGKSE